MADASVVLGALLHDGPARRVLVEPQVHVPHLVDSEVTSGLRRLVSAGTVSEGTGRSCLDTLAAIGVTRHAVTGLLPRMWELRDTVSAYDAGYVALAEELDCALVTGDARLARAPGVRCTVTVVRS